jgi:cytoskeletal protein RodZ
MYGYSSMMGGMGFFGLLTWLVVLVDLVLVGVWLWKEIAKK